MVGAPVLIISGLDRIPQKKEQGGGVYKKIPPPILLAKFAIVITDVTKVCEIPSISGVKNDKLQISLFAEQKTYLIRGVNLHTLSTITTGFFQLDANVPWLDTKTAS